MYQNPTSANNGIRGSGASNRNGSSRDPTQQPQQNVNYNGMPPQQLQEQQSQSNNTNKNVRKKPFVKITEQPASKALRFRYECEGRSAGSIPGAKSTAETKTYPSIEICGIKGRAVVVVSCVTKDLPYRPHPHNLVGKDGCKKGVCTLEINSDSMRAVFSNLGIQCVKKKDIESALKAREEIRVDPFKTGFSHKLHPSSIDLNAVRLCFQVFIESDQKGRFTDPLKPVVSEPIFDKKAMSDLVICRLCSCSATVLGNTQIILLCEKVAKEDISIRFFEENNGKMVWEAYGEFNHSDVHKQTAITFKTPRYRSLDITEPAKVYIQLRRPSDGITSEALPFEYVPLDSGRHTFWNLRRNLKRKPDLDLFQEILTVDSVAGIGEVEPALVQPTEIIDLNTPTKEQQDIQVFITQPSTDQELEEAAIRRSMHEIDTIIDEKVRELEQQRDQQQQRQNTVESMDQEEDSLLTEEPRQLSANDKCNEWMKSHEFETMPSTETNSTITPQTTIDKLSPQSTFDEDKTLRELLGQVAELDEIYTDHIMRRDTYNNSILHELNGIDACLPDSGQTAMEIDENFDDAATYTSLQIAFKNPISLPIEDMMPPTPPASHMAPEDAQHYDHVEVMTQSTVPASPRTETYSQSPPRPAPPKLSAAQPHMHITAAEEEKLPPLPPKRQRKLEQDSNAENRSISANSSDTLDRKSLRQSGTIIIMKTPDQSPPNKRLPPKPDPKFNTLPRQKKKSEDKKPGFFSKLFSRRKSRSDQSEASGSVVEQNSLAGSKCVSKATSPDASREPSIKQFPLIDPKRASSIRSIKSLQQAATSLPTSPAKGGASPAKTKTGKPVGRSVSSVSGKRPAHLNADVIHIPLKGGDSYNSLPQQTNAQEAYSNASTITLGNTLDRRTVSALHLAEIPLCDGNMELVAITDRQSLRNLCEGEFNVQLDPNVDLTEAEHFALYTSIPPVATASEFDEMSAYYASVDAGEILTPDEIAKRLTAANRIH